MKSSFWHIESAEKREKSASLLDSDFNYKLAQEFGYGFSQRVSFRVPTYQHEWMRPAQLKIRSISLQVGRVGTSTGCNSKSSCWCTILRAIEIIPQALRAHTLVPLLVTSTVYSTKSTCHRSPGS